jgi:glucose-1-phosphate thymidylyltransferase
VVQIAKKITPSQRGELEITDINQAYLKSNNLRVQLLGRGFTWLDTGTHDSLMEAGNFIETIEKRQGLKVACLEEIAYGMKYIDAKQVKKLAEPLKKNGYGQYLLNMIKE